VVSELRALTFDGSDELWLEEILLRTRPPLDELQRSGGFLGELLRAAEAVRADPALVAELAAPLDGLRGRLGEELARAGLDLGDPAVLGELVADAEGLLAARLTERR
jgi:hypothetical protein